MTDKLQPMITALQTLLKTAGYRYVEQYSIENINRMGANLPAILIYPESKTSEQSQGCFEAEAQISVLIFMNKAYQRSQTLLSELNKIQTVIANNPQISGTICNIPRYSIDYGSDAITTDMTTPGTVANNTIGKLTFTAIFKEE